jgi:hypothetical protein
MPSTGLLCKQPPYGGIRAIDLRTGRTIWDKDQSNVHHDALEFPDGKIVLLTHLCEGQRATVLQLPARPRVTVDDAQRHDSLVV